MIVRFLELPGFSHDRVNGIIWSRKKLNIINKSVWTEVQQRHRKCEETTDSSDTWLFHYRISSSHSRAASVDIVGVAVVTRQDQMFWKWNVCTPKKKKKKKSNIGPKRVLSHFWSACKCFVSDYSDYRIPPSYRIFCGHVNGPTANVGTMFASQKTIGLVHDLSGKWPFFGHFCVRYKTATVKKNKTCFYQIFFFKFTSWFVFFFVNYWWGTKYGNFTDTNNFTIFFTKVINSGSVVR